MDYHKVFVGDLGLRYVVEVLGRGLTLSRKMLQILATHGGSLSTFLPGRIEASRITDFARGGIASREQSLDCVVAACIQLMERCPAAICMLENRYATPDDEWLASCRSQIGVFQDEVYHLVPAISVSPERVRTAVLEAQTSLDFIGVISSPGMK